MCRLLLIGLLLLSRPATAQVVLTPGQAVERDLASDGSDIYTLDLDADQFVLGHAFQHTVDVVVTVADPDGEPIGVFDSPARGPEMFTFTSREAGPYTLTVTPFEGAEGRYAITIDRSEPVATAPEALVDQKFAWYDRPGSPGCAVGVYRDGAAVFEKGYGTASLEHDVPITPRTVFDLGSTSKQFTAASLILLEQQGKLSLDDDVRQYLPELPEYSRTITLRHLLHHTSGLRDYIGLLLMAGYDIDDATTDREALDLVVRQQALNFEPGEAYLYSNTGYFLASLVVERVSGQTLRAFASENLFEPLGMSNTTYLDDHRELIPNRAVGYEEGGTGAYVRDVSYWEQNGDGAVFSTVEDLARWDRNFYDPKVGGEALISELTRRGVLVSGDTIDYAQGLYFGEYRGRETVGHGGSWGGYRAVFLRLPAERTTVAVLCNVGSSNPSVLAEGVLDAFLGGDEWASDVPALDAPGPPGEGFDPASFDPESFDAFAGRYELTSGMVLTIQRDGARYFAQATGQSEIEIFPVALDRFDVPGVGAQITFHIAGDGSVPALTLHQRGDHLANRLEDVPEGALEEAPLADYVGHYFSEELGVQYTIALVEGELTLSHHRMKEPGTLARSSGDAFTGGRVLPTMEFDRDASGVISGFRAGTGRTRGVHFEKVDRP